MQKIIVYLKENQRFYGLILIFVICLWLFVIGWMKYNLYDKSILTSDMSFYSNMLWNTDFKGDFLRTKILFDQYGYNTFLNEHFTPTLLLLAPLYHLIPYPLFLVFLQVILAGISAFLIYILATMVISKKRLAFFAALAYLFHPSLISAVIDNVYGFHHDSLILPLFILAAIFLFRQKIFPFALSLFLLLGLKENIPLAGIILGIGCLMIKKYRKFGFTAVIFSLLFFLAGVWLLPYFSGIGNHHAADALGMISSFFGNEFLARLSSMAYWLVLLLFWPAVFAPEILLLAIPDLGMYFLAQKLPFYHHVFLVFSIFAAASIFGIKRLLNSNQFSSFWSSHRGKRIFYFFTTMLVALFVAGNIAVGWRYLKLQEKFSLLDVDKNSVAEAKTIIPYNACLCATSDLAVYFANRPCLSWIAKSIGTSDFIIINRNAQFGFDYDKAMIKEMDIMSMRGSIRPILEKGSIILFKKIN